MSPQRVVRYAARYPWRTILLAVGIAIVAVVMWTVQDTANTARDAAASARRTARTAQRTAATAQEAAASARRAIAAVQHERARATREACNAVNARNRRSVKFLAALPPSPGQRSMSPAEKDRLLRAFTDALVGPVRNCTALVHRLVATPSRH